MYLIVIETSSRDTTSCQFILNAEVLSAPHVHIIIVPPNPTLFHYRTEKQGVPRGTSEERTTTTGDETHSWDIQLVLSCCVAISIQFARVGN